MDTVRQQTTPTIVPFLRYRDAAAAIDWLVAAFGAERWLVMAGPDGGIAHAELRLGDGFVMLGSETEGSPLGMRSPKDVGAITQGLYVLVAPDDLDAHHARAVASGAEVLIPLQDMDYGSREYTVRDLEGHVWSFGTYRPASMPAEPTPVGAAVGE